MKKKLEKIVGPVLVAGFIGLGALGNHIAESKGTKGIVGFPYRQIHDVNRDGEPDRTDSYVATRGVMYKTSREPTREEIEWYKSQK